MLKKQLKLSEQDANITLKKDKFIQAVIHSNALSCNNVMSDDFDIEKSKRKSDTGLAALDISGGLQALLASQLLGIHQLQQTAMTMVNGLSFGNASQYYMNTAIKLSNTFVQQASLLAKLQGAIGQKFVVERVDVHDGGQAVIGAVNSGAQADKAKI